MDTSETMLNNQQLIIELQKRIYFSNQELIFSQNFHDTIKGSEWLPQDFAFSPCRYAIGYPCLYIMYRILNEIQPSSILELGMGQSTKMIGVYSAWKGNCHHFVVEHDKDWVEFFERNFKLPKTTEVVELDIAKNTIEYEGKQCELFMYQNFFDTFREKTFDFIFIDGPFGGGDISRIDVMGILPDSLNDDFIILMDDCERIGESNSMNIISQLLQEHGIEHSRGYYQGEKGVGIIASPKFSFVTSL